MGFCGTHLGTISLVVLKIAICKMQRFTLFPYLSRVKELIEIAVIHHGLHDLGVGAGGVEGGGVAGVSHYKAAVLPI